MAECRSPCPVCGAGTQAAGYSYSSFSHRAFALRRCGNCGFAFVSDPRLDYDRLYEEQYYSGRGADPLVDYLYELEHPDTTIRRLEWRGILKVVSSLTPVGPHTRWLDYGCGTGGLVAYLRAQGILGAVGFEPGWAGRLLAGRGDLAVSRDDLDRSQGAFDVVSLIEVIEHAVDPTSELQRARKLLRPGGLCFLTTGNAEPYRHRLPHWGYVVPDVHVSFFEPRSLAVALGRAGFEVAWPGYRRGWEDIIGFKVLKNLRVRSGGRPLELIPWRVPSRVVDRRLRVTAHPVGWAR